jgi:hypothetical protein
MKLLALDLATCTGFALGSTEQGVLEHGSHRILKTGEDVGLYLVTFRDWLLALVARTDPWTIYFEAPVLLGRDKTSLNTLRKLYGLAGMTEVVAHDRGIDCREANTSNIVTHFCGKGSPRYGDERKKATMAKCRERGWTITDDNDADALALLDYALAQIKPEHALQSTPLFAGSST